MRPSIHPFDAALGAEVRGVDLATPVSEDDFVVVERAFAEHSVLLFRDQDLSPARHVAFSHRFGSLEIHVLDQWRHPDHPEILIVSNVKEGERHVGNYNAGRFWHTDLSYMRAPSRGSLLYAIEIPHDNDHALGDTLFASTAAAYDALPEATKRRIEGLRATFSLARHRERLAAEGDAGAALTQEQKAKTPAATHSVVQRHPVTGRRCLFVNEGHTVAIEGLPPDESDALLTELCAHATREEFTWRQRWRPGDLLMWDNHATQHRAIFDYAWPQRRYLHRTTLEGPPLD